MKIVLMSALLVSGLGFGVTAMDEFRYEFDSVMGGPGSSKAVGGYTGATVEGDASKTTGYSPDSF